MHSSLQWQQEAYGMDIGNILTFNLTIFSGSDI